VISLTFWVQIRRNQHQSWNSLSTEHWCIMAKQSRTPRINRMRQHQDTNVHFPVLPLWFSSDHLKYPKPEHFPLLICPQCPLTVMAILFATRSGLTGMVEVYQMFGSSAVSKSTRVAVASYKNYRKQRIITKHMKNCCAKQVSPFIKLNKIC